MAVIKHYLRLTPTENSKLSLEDSKELIGYLSKLTISDFELSVKNQANNGLELYLSLNAQDVDPIRRHIYAICPDLRIEEVKKASARLSRPTLSRHYRFSRHYAYPLLVTDESPDTLSKFLQHFRQIDGQQSVEFLLKAKQVKPLRAWLLRSRLLRGCLPRLEDPSLSGLLKRCLFLLMSAVVLIIRFILYMLQSLVFSSALMRNQLTKNYKVSSPKSVTLLDKLYEPLYKTSLTVSIKTRSIEYAESIMNDTSLALNNFAKSSGYQQLRSTNNKLGHDLYSASDLAAFFHIDSTDIKNGLFSVEHFKSLPDSSKHSKQKLPGEVVIGFNTYQGSNNELVINHNARQRHLYITGATGSGKSTLLANLILQDIASGQGLSIIDPHGDLVTDIIQRIPKDRLSDIVYFDPTDQKSKLSLNLLEVKSRPGTSQYSQETDQVTESLISLFRKVFSSEDSGGHRVEYILRNTIHTALDIPGSNLFTIFRLLTDGGYRLHVIPTIKDQHLVNFWRNELGRAGEYQRVKMSAGVTSKIGRFLFSEPSRRVFGQSATTLDVAKLMNEQKILICNFSKGKLGEDGSKLFSAVMLTKIQLAALARVNLRPADRPDHYLYIDEFQNHAPSVVIQMLSEARKYGLYLTMAEQSPYQQDSQSTNVILANTGNLICFRTALPKDEGLLMPNFNKYITSNDLNELPAYKFYFKSTAEEYIPPTSGQSYPLSANYSR